MKLDVDILGDDSGSDETAGWLVRAYVREGRKGTRWRRVERRRRY